MQEVPALADEQGDHVQGRESVGSMIGGVQDQWPLCDA